MLNDDQRDYLKGLASHPPEERCWCGWFLKGKCDTPHPCPPDKSEADRLAASCPECGGSPAVNGTHGIWHRGGCSMAANALEVTASRSECPSTEG